MQLGFSMSNWQKVQFNTDLLIKVHEYLYAMKKEQLKLNGIKAIKVWLKSEIKLESEGSF